MFEVSKEVGEEIRYGNEGTVAIITRSTPYCWDCLEWCGNTFRVKEEEKPNWHKTGKKYTQLTKILKEMDKDIDRLNIEQKR